MFAQRLAIPFRNLPAVLMMAIVLPLLAGCGYNTIPTLEEQAKARWFGGPDGWEEHQRQWDFRVDGKRPHLAGQVTPS